MPHLSNKIFVVHIFGPVATGGFGGLSPPKRSAKHSQIKICNTINQWSFYQFFNVKPPYTNAKPPY